MYRTNRYSIEQIEPRQYRWTADGRDAAGQHQVRQGLAGSFRSAQQAARACADRLQVRK